MYSASGPGQRDKVGCLSTIIDTSAFTAIFSKLREAPSGVTNSTECVSENGVRGKTLSSAEIAADLLLSIPRFRSHAAPSDQLHLVQGNEFLPY